MLGTLLVTDFQKGMRVRYVPSHAFGDTTHKDCQDGVVSSISPNQKFVFVKYDNAVCQMLTGDEPYTSQATYPTDLIILGRTQERN